MSISTLLIHDTRTMGVITAAVLARVLPRGGDGGKGGEKIYALFGRDLTFSTQKFWREAKSIIGRELNEHPCGKVILCCVGFDDFHWTRCLETLKWLESQAELVIYSHKWPNGYTRAGFDVRVSPHAIVEEFSGRIEPVESELLRTSLIVSRETDPDSVNEADKLFADQLAKKIWPAQSELEAPHWERLTRSLEEVIEEIKTPGGVDPQAKVTRLDRDTRFVLYELAEDPPISIEKTLEARAEDGDFPVPGIAIGLVNWGDPRGSRVYLLRPWKQRKGYPSIAHLVNTYGDKYGLLGERHGLRGWVGGQDALHLRISSGQSDEYKRLIETLPGQLRGFCNSVAGVPYGSRQPHAWAARFIHQRATETLERLDLFKAFVDPVNRQLYFDPDGTQIILSQSNRSHEPFTQTLALRLVVKTPNAAAFLFGHGGYNFTKLETALDGALAAIAKIPSLWLGATAVPSKLRIDADFRSTVENIDENFGEVLGRAFGQLREFAPLTIGAAIKSGVVEKESVIARALEQDDEPLVVFRGSETIGPSVQYAVLAHAVVDSLHRKLGRKIEVLELFSGSGYCSRKLTKPDGMARVVCVDASVDATTALVHDKLDVIWLRTLVDQVVSPDGIYYRSYDVVLMDPPHGMLLEILFGGGAEGSVAERVSKMTSSLVIYVGHDSQATRCQTVARALQQWYSQVTEWRVGSERLISAGHSRTASETAWEYGAIIEEVLSLAILKVKEFNPYWPVEIVGRHPAEI